MLTTCDNSMFSALSIFNISLMIDTCKVRLFVSLTGHNTLPVSLIMTDHSVLLRYIGRMLVLVYHGIVLLINRVVINCGVVNYYVILNNLVRSPL